ncbi:acetylxylan esterase [Neolewinella sp.]|uniref:glucuronyl esterase domain-containing protein n=1 Tax=Neolewinella sp. TaxID=2993543 RepID=UPI003B51CD37
MTHLRYRNYFLVYLLLTACGYLPAQTPQPNYDEAQVPAYTLPDPLIATDGTPVTAAEWPARRAELLRLFEDHVYGSVPGELDSISWQIVEEGEAMRGKALRRQVAISMYYGPHELRAGLLLYVPNQANGPVPVLLGMNFFGNHAVLPDTAVLLTPNWLPNQETYGITEHRAMEASRGARGHRWNPELVVGRGYAFATIYSGDFDGDRPDDWTDGVHPLFYTGTQQRPAVDEWGTIAAWAWGYSRAIDYLVTDSLLNPNQIVIMGHSRMGKAALWAGANDARAAVVVSNNSGCGGAALSRRRYGETVASINEAFPHWFNDRFPEYAGREEDLPVDQHELIALVAPRPVYVASAVDDRWADPRGEFLAAYHAGPVYRLLGASGLPQDTPPPPNEALDRATIGYHLRRRGHAVLDYDWNQFIDFANYHFASSAD